MFRISALLIVLALAMVFGIEAIDNSSPPLPSDVLGVNSKLSIE